METTKFLSDKEAEKSKFRKLSIKKQKKKTENAIPAATKKPQTLNCRIQNLR